MLDPIEKFNVDIIELINKSELPPSIIKLVLNNIIDKIELNQMKLQISNLEKQIETNQIKVEETEI